MRDIGVNHPSRTGFRLPWRVVAGLILAATVLVRPASAQDRRTADEASRPDFRTGRVQGGRLDLDRPVWRARYGESMRVEPGAPASRIAERLYEVFGGELPAGTLHAVGERNDGPVRHIRYQQVVDGVPVLDRYVTVSLDGKGRVRYAMNGFDYGVAAGPKPAPAVLDADDAVERARTELDGWGGRLGPATLVVVPGNPARLAWRLYAWPEAPPSEWRVLVDAVTGEVTGLQDETVRKTGRAMEVEGGHGPPDPASVSFSATSPLDVTTDGRGAVFDPDPLATSGEAYGPPYADADDQDIPELNQERVPVTLREITRGNDGKYRLNGPYVSIVGENQAGTRVYTPPVELTSDGFSYTRANDGFEAVTTYYFLDESQRHIQDLGFTDIQATPLPVNPAGTAADESGWIASLRYIFYGTGGVDDAEDAFVLLHEYGHAVLEAGAPGLRSTLEGQALHEGWSDYWASSYEKYVMDEGRTIRTDWENTFRWDAGDGTIWSGRTLDHSGTYPASTCTDNPSPCSDIYNDGRLWATVLMEIHQELGRDLTDRLNLLSHRYLSAPVTFADAANALVQADIDYYDGEHLDVLVGRLAPRGLVDVSDFWPTVRHEALLSSEETGTPISISVEAIGYSSPIVEVAVVYRLGSDPAQTVLLAPSGGHTWSGSMPGPMLPDSVHYFVRVRDELDRTVLLPEQAPEAEFAFYVGPDVVAPAIGYDPIELASVVSWPPTVEVIATDGIGVSSVDVEYSVFDPLGAQVASGSFALTRGEGDLWVGEFPVAVGSVRHGSTVRYAITASDAAASPNEARSPATGWHEFGVTGTGVLRRFDAASPQPGVQVSGSWEPGEPQYGVFASPTGGPVWATVHDGATEASAGLSRLRLPSLDLRGLDQVWLVFRHWYDTEHDGSARPGVNAGDVLWDGGNVKISTDGGLTWRVAMAEGPYSGTIRSGEGNPLAGEEAFGGYSYAWRREIVSLPISADVAIAFDFGTDGSNTDESVGYAGWYLDDVRVMTELPVDDSPPEVTEAPAGRIVWPAGPVKPLVSVRAVDGTGVGEVWLDYEWTRDAEAIRDSLRVPMSPYDVSLFETVLDAGLEPEPDDHVEYRFRLVDVSGNRATWPAAGEPWLVFDVMRTDEVDMASSARPGGGWFRAVSGWSVRDSTGSLVLVPKWLAGNSRDTYLEIVHHYAFGPGRGGRAEVSTDDGESWSLLRPEAGYPSAIGNAGAWDGQNLESRVDRFDLGPFRGELVQVRFSVVAIGSWSPLSWTIESVQFEQQTADPSFDLPETPLLHANFPDPFVGYTNISVTLPDAGPVTLAVYDVLGRRVAVLMDGSPAPGTHSMTFDASSLAPGVYLLRLDADGTILTERMVKSR